MEMNNVHLQMSPDTVMLIKQYLKPKFTFESETLHQTVRTAFLARGCASVLYVAVHSVSDILW